jgi:hypothetical protein
MRGELFAGLKPANTLHYRDIRQTIENGDVLLYEGFNTASRIIRWATRSRYSHAGIAVWWNNRLMVMEAVGKGVSVSTLSANVRHYHGHVHWYSTREPVSKGQRDAMILFAQEELGKKYALWKAITLGLALLLHRNQEKQDALRRESKLYCSWYVAQIYNAAGLDLIKGVSDRFMTPQDIARSPLLERKGALKIFRKRYHAPVALFFTFCRSFTIKDTKRAKE